MCQIIKKYYWKSIIHYLIYAKQTNKQTDRKGKIDQKIIDFQNYQKKKDKAGYK